MSIPEAQRGAFEDGEDLHPKMPQLPRGLAAEVRKSSESQLALIFNGVSDLLFLIGVEAGPQFRCLAVNPSYVKKTGWTHDHLEGKLLEEFLPPEKARFVVEKYTAAMQSRSPTTYEESTHVPAGWLVVETTLTPVFDEQGTCTHLLGASRDITERKRMVKALQESEERYRNLFENANDAIATFTLDGTITSVNRAAERLLGWSRAELVGQHVSKATTPSSVALAEERTRRFLAGERLSSAMFEAELVHKDGSAVTVEAHTSVIRDAAGKPVGFQGIYRDITERKNAERVLRESEERYRLISQSISDYAFSFRLDVQGKLTLEWLTDSFTQVTGYTAAEMLARPTPLATHIHPEDRARVLHTLRSLQPGQLSTYELRLIRKDGTVRWAQSRIRAIADEAGKLIRLYGAVSDITERKLMEAALRGSEQRYRAVVETQTELICRFLPDTTLTFVNGAYCRYFGKSREELLGTSFLALIPEHARPVAKAHIDSLVVNPRLVINEHEVVAAERDIRWQRWTDQAIFDTTGQLTEFQSTGQDITERKQAEEQLKESETRLRLLTELIPQQVWSALPDGSIDYVNQRWLDYTGLTLKEAQGDGWADVLSPDDREQTLRIWRDALSEGTLYETEERLRGADGKQRWFLARALPLRDPQGCITKWYGTNTDIEDRKHAEEVVRQLQMELAQVGRVTAMGAMAASIAHEVNQPLGAIVGNADICLRWLVSATPDLGKVRDALSDIIADGHRASEVVARIRSLFKNEASQKTSFGINEVVREALALVNHETQRRRVVLRAELASDVPLVRGDRVQLRQVVLNLIINGIEAMSGIEEGKRELVIRSGRDERYGVRITVQDCGVGIDPREAQRLFTAFYTTKPGGMGMGLAICRLIVEAHGGRLWVVPHSRPGATFQFALPASGEEER